MSPGRISLGCIIAFDEIECLAGCEHEAKAFAEFLKTTKLNYNIVGKQSYEGTVYRIL
jgi:hypothetical protein